MATKDRENVLMQLGDYCTTHTCKHCFIRKIAADHNHGCPECFRIPEVAQQISEALKHRRTRKEQWEDAEDGN